ncbi:MAG: D-alanine--D-alanine ligase [Longimicrobiales bacterium]|nr:D-alanine--D-alanine ligase [Longimicrobiales bacterium]
MKITVLLGGDSDERDVSLATGVQMSAALRAAGHDVVAFDTARCRVLGRAEEDALLREGVPPTPAGARESDRIALGEVNRLFDHPDAGGADLFAIALHGGRGEDGTLQGVLEDEGLVYTGSDPEGCRLAMDKDASKTLMRAAGLPTPHWLTDVFDPEHLMTEVGLPIVIKAAHGGSSLRLELVRDREALEVALAEARAFDDRVVAEAYVSGREFTVGIVGDETLPVGEIIPEHELFDYECKYQPGMAREIFPAEVDEAAAARMSTLALEVHRVLGLRDYSRVDFMMDREGEIWCLEANNLPGMTGNSLLPRAARAAGIDFPALCDRIVRSAAARRNSLRAHGV